MTTRLYAVVRNSLQLFVYYSSHSFFPVAGVICVKYIRVVIKEVKLKEVLTTQAVKVILFLKRCFFFFSV